MIWSGSRMLVRMCVVLGGRGCGQGGRMMVVGSRWLFVGGRSFVLMVGGSCRLWAVVPILCGEWLWFMGWMSHVVSGVVRGKVTWCDTNTVSGPTSAKKPIYQPTCLISTTPRRKKGSTLLTLFTTPSTTSPLNGLNTITRYRILVKLDVVVGTRGRSSIVAMGPRGRSLADHHHHRCASMVGGHRRSSMVVVGPRGQSSMVMRREWW